jgi:hypothetical protein
MTTDPIDPVDELARIRRELRSLADARRMWSSTPRDDARWLELCNRERAFLQ